MSEARIRARGLTRTFTGGVGVRAIDLDVEPGQIHALVGLNGAGKSTLMRLLLGMLRPDAGTVRIDGVELSAAPWGRVGHLIETPLAYGELDGRTNLTLAARLHGIPAAAAPVMVTSILTELNLHRYAGIRARRMSLGNRQRLGLAAALQHHPDLIVLDEPTNALDPAGAAAAAAATILVSSHDLDEVARQPAMRPASSGRVMTRSLRGCAGAGPYTARSRHGGGEGVGGSLGRTWLPTPGRRRERR